MPNLRRSEPSPTVTMERDATRRGRGRFGDDRLATSRAYKDALEGWFGAVIKVADTGRVLWTCRHMHASRADAFNCAAMRIIRTLPRGGSDR
jgi:hypothetical protein